MVEVIRTAAWIRKTIQHPANLRHPTAKLLINTRRRLRRFPSPMFDGIETAARLICAVSPNRSREETAK
jgi:hypothetical protein